MAEITCSVPSKTESYCRLRKKERRRKLGSVLIFPWQNSMLKSFRILLNGVLLRIYKRIGIFTEIMSYTAPLLCKICLVRSTINVLEYLVPLTWHLQRLICWWNWLTEMSAMYSEVPTASIKICFLITLCWSYLSHWCFFHVPWIPYTPINIKCWIWKDKCSVPAIWKPVRMF